MKIRQLELANFKAIESTTIDLHPTFNVLVGSNGSGKSSVLQALHWVLQSGRNEMVKPNAVGKASTLSERNAIFMPSPEYLSAGHGADYGNFGGNPQLDLRIVAVDDQHNEIEAKMWLKAARNEGISVHIPANNEFTTAVRDRKREISAYIPGLAGIPLIEEKRSKLIVHRSAAAGDANMVLRNMLELLRNKEINGRNGLDLVSELVSRVVGQFFLKVEFDESIHTRVVANFHVGTMGPMGDKFMRPLELAGIGYLQVLQIFCYLIYFRPVLLLVDEPDAHLYPIAQERLVEVLYEVAASLDSQVILTTHSPSIVRSLPQDSKVVWMKNGAVQHDGDVSTRHLMGWGLLDRKIVLLTEDTQTGMLKSLIAQWPDLERVTAIWPFHGTGKMPTPETLAGFQSLIGPGVNLVLHRDRDFLMPSEVEEFAKPYKKKGYRVWFTKHSDIEAYWGEPTAVAAHFHISLAEAERIINKAYTQINSEGDSMKKMRKKRTEAIQNINRSGEIPHYGDEQVVQEVSRGGQQFTILGKTLISEIRKIATEERLNNVNTFAKCAPSETVPGFANDLQAILRSCVD